MHLGALTKIHFFQHLIFLLLPLNKTMRISEFYSLAVI